MNNELKFSTEKFDYLELECPKWKIGEDQRIKYQTIVTFYNWSVADP